MFHSSIWNRCKGRTVGGTQERCECYFSFLRDSEEQMKFEGFSVAASFRLESMRSETGA